jgi:hypothetical protein
MLKVLVLLVLGFAGGIYVRPYLDKFFARLK